jgi:hypothetical protein
MSLVAQKCCRDEPGQWWQIFFDFFEPWKKDWFKRMICNLEQNSKKGKTIWALSLHTINLFRTGLMSWQLNLGSLMWLCLSLYSLCTLQLVTLDTTLLALTGWVVQLIGARVGEHSSLLTAIWTGNSNLPEEDSCNVVDSRNCRT